jgi:NADP-dependent aldehyde dehydrogenase
MRDEIFGPAAIVVRTCDDMLRDVFSRGSLTLSVFLDEGEEPTDWLPYEMRYPLAGRIIFNGVPTGVRVCDAMVHGGPFPATNRPDTTAVGPRAIERWCRPVCCQNCPDQLLPPELQNANPFGILRRVNGTLTAAPIPG